jgi:hypothetical protein
VVNASIGKEGRMVDRNVGEELLEERRRRRRAGDPRIKAVRFSPDSSTETSSRSSRPPSTP